MKREEEEEEVNPINMLKKPVQDENIIPKSVSDNEIE